MNRLALFVSATFLLSCVAADEPETSSVDQSATAGCDGKTYNNPCIVPTIWSSATQSTISDFWYGIGASPSKVMYYVEMYGRSAAEVGGGETSPSMYVLYGAGAFDGTNQVWKAVEVKGSDITTYHKTRTTLYDSYELLGGIWHGGAGVPLGGEPGGHIGPHGFPISIISPFLNLFAGTRSDYGTKILGTNGGINGFMGQ
jgi:hypothetical protein